MKPPPRRAFGWTEKQWAASIMASLYGGPGVVGAVLAVQRADLNFLVVSMVFLLIGLFIFWALSTAGESHGR